MPPQHPARGVKMMSQAYEGYSTAKFTYFLHIRRGFVTGILQKRVFDPFTLALAQFNHHK